MKIPAIIIFLLASLNILAQKTYVPDDNFEQALIDLGYDDVLDDSVLTANINGITSLNVGNKNISDLTGIQDFTSLTELNCNSNQLTNLNISENTALTELFCNSNKLKNLDVSANTDLTLLDCQNNQLTYLNVSANTALIDLQCNSNQLIDLDVRNGNNTNFTDFDARNNPDLKCIFVDNAKWSTSKWTKTDANSKFAENEEECAHL